MLLRDPFGKALWDNRRNYLGWTAALTAVAMMYASLWPSIGDNPALTSAMDAYPETLKQAFAMQDLSLPQNYLGSTVFGLLVPLLLAVFAIAAGTKALATDEEAGTLDLVLAHPVGRTRLALQRFAAIAVGVALIVGVILLALLALRGPAEYTAVSPANLAATSAQLALFGLFFAALSFAVGAATGRKGLALGVGSAVAVLGYLANSFLPQVEALRWTQRLSPFHWYLDGQPLFNGFQWSGSALLLAGTAALLAAGVWAFNHRDITV
jgi:ABC-2 type transport system permease protein